MIESRHTVLGMVCGHCAEIVGEEIGRVPGVTDVRVDVAAETVVVRADRPVPEALIHAAVAESGYTPGSPPADAAAPPEDPGAPARS
ncbi:cation transporter [Streptomyces synnematoformans]|uniref:HMA domain-containing protein n=1 Tax=Streptomyces synnematoformans TaxID=415721 RepID=A0ABN2YVM4_9ACTN